MRAGRLLNVLLLLRSRGRMSAAQLAAELEVSVRTILRDLDDLSGAGVPVYAVRGRDGGFQLLDATRADAPPVGGLGGSRGQLRRVRVRVAPSALELALVRGQPEGWRPRPSYAPSPDRPDWIEGSFRFRSDDEALTQLAALTPYVEVLLPEHLREAMARLGAAVADLHAEPPYGFSATISSPL